VPACAPGSIFSGGVTSAVCQGTCELKQTSSAPEYRTVEDADGSQSARLSAGSAEKGGFKISDLRKRKSQLLTSLRIKPNAMEVTAFPTKSPAALNR